MQTKPADVIKGETMYGKSVSAGVGFCAFLLFALALTVPSGYSYGAVGLVIFSLAGVGLLRRGASCGAGIALGGILLAMGLLWGMSFDGWWSWTGSDYWPKYWLAAACLPVLGLVGVPAGKLQWGLAAGSVGALGVAAYQYLVQEMVKATGFTNAIQYGDLAMYMGLATWCFALFNGRGWKQSLLLWLYGACGVLASLLSETRGGWVVAPMLLVVMLWALFRNGRAKLALATVVAVGVLMAAVLIPYGKKYEERMEQGLTQLHQYETQPQQFAATSIGQRLEQWRLAWRMIKAKPVVGWGTQGVIIGKQALVDQGLAHPSVMKYGHAHNEILDMWVKRGALGLVLLLLFYTIPLTVFWPTRQRLAAVLVEDQAGIMALRIAASLLPLAYFGFGWTQVFFAHNSGNLFYIFALVSFYGGIKAVEARRIQAAQSA
ncbi:O-antigen ligase family protein [Comamonas sp. GB3 AK4-5]|uniref:O-antigen ligase family protein n=1 Tax=Comamonas sp. GB3 AK4-5 TaxID=3231487 RepID=UPI00351F7A87